MIVRSSQREAPPSPTNGEPARDQHVIHFDFRRVERGESRQRFAIDECH